MTTIDIDYSGTIVPGLIFIGVAAAILLIGIIIAIVKTVRYGEWEWFLGTIGIACLWLFAGSYPMQGMYEQTRQEQISRGVSEAIGEDVISAERVGDSRNYLVTTYEGETIVVTYIESEQEYRFDA